MHYWQDILAFITIVVAVVYTTKRAYGRLRSFASLKVDSKACPSACGGCVSSGTRVKAASATIHFVRNRSNATAEKYRQLF